ncbi:MAG: VWA domain-containing protein, partial [Verrucomicrobiales bacterium]|nr:VWA domain-containing protein [Verrucomicrobiales bacterium]
MKKFALPLVVFTAGLLALPPAGFGRSVAKPETVGFVTKVDRPLLVKGAGEQKVIIKIDINGVPIGQKLDRMPLNIALVIDRSGSMTGKKLEQAKQAAEMLVDQLGPKDIFSLVMYDTDVDVLIGAQPVGTKRDHFKRTIRKINAGGSTALYHGVERGGQQLEEYFGREKINRVILLSDGIANVGPSSNREIAQLGQRLARRQISVSTIGLGDNYNENLMTALAEASDANYYYVADVEELPDVFRRELGELQTIVAREIIIEVICPD